MGVGLLVKHQTSSAWAGCRALWSRKRGRTANHGGRGADLVPMPFSILRAYGVPWRRTRAAMPCVSWFALMLDGLAGFGVSRNRLRR